MKEDRDGIECRRRDHWILDPERRRKVEERAAELIAEEVTPAIFRYLSHPMGGRPTD